MRSLTLTIILLISVNPLFSSQWIDPSWEELIRDSEVIGLFEVTEGGLDSGKVKPIRMLKGSLKEEITLSNFNDLYWPQDTQEKHALKEDEKLYFFLSTTWAYKIKAWGYTDTSTDDIKTEKLFTPTPTAGIIPFNQDKTVNYTLLSPSYSWAQKAHPAGEFEEFIRNTVSYIDSKKRNEEALSELLEQIHLELKKEVKQELSSKLPNLIAMYRLWGGESLGEEFADAIKHENPEVRYQSAKLLGKSLPSKNAENMLIQLLDDSHPMVQGQAVNNLMEIEDKDRILGILTQKLTTALPGGAGPESIMDPVLNSENGGLLAIIDYIAKYKYFEAEDELLSVMTHAQDSTVLYAAFNALGELGCANKTQPLLKHLRGNNADLRDQAIELSEHVDSPEILRELEKLLMFAEPDDFLVVKIFRVLSKDSLPTIIIWFNKYFPGNTHSHWIGEIGENTIALVNQESPTEAHELVEEIMFHFTGVDMRFLDYPEALNTKLKLEAELSSKILKAAEIDVTWDANAYSFVQIDNVEELTKDKLVKTDYRYHVDLVITAPEEEHEEYLKQKKIDATLSLWDKVDLESMRVSISDKTGIPIDNIGIQFKYTRSFSLTSNHDERSTGFTGWKIARAYGAYANRMPSEKHENLIRFYIERGIADHMDSTQIFRRYIK